MAEFTEIEKATKALYIKQHQAYHQDTSIFDRFYAVASKPSTYGVADDFFRGKTIIDIGCGNTAYFQKAMYDSGAGHMTCLDVGEDWIPELEAALDSHGVPRDFYTCVAGSANNLPFADEHFDFVASNGVIMHLNGVDEAERAFDEMARVTKTGGSLYVYVGLSTGIVDNYMLPAMRQAYRDVSGFKSFIDNCTPETLSADLEKYLDVVRAHDQELEGPMRHLFALFTLDTITFWQNVLQVPVQQGTKLSREWGENQFAKHNFGNVRRTPSVYWPRNDVRRFLVPMHFDTTNPVSQLLYGDGHIKLVGEKKA